MEKKDKPTLVCVICRGPIDGPYGHNAWPILDGRCCTVCNDMAVIPTRIRRWRAQQQIE